MLERENGPEGRAVRALVVEDDASINDVICSTLGGSGFLCTRLLIERDSFDLVVCDLMLPGMPGEEIVSLIRKRSAVPILVTSAKAQVVDRVALLRMGADDYLVKPFDLDELVARVEALLRRSKHPTAGISDSEDLPASIYGKWTLFEDARRLEAAGKPIKLTCTEFDIVAALMRHPRKVFTKRELYREVWHEDAAVNTHVSNIRAKLKGTGTESYIETVWGIGFKLAEIE